MSLRVPESHRVISGIMATLPNSGNYGAFQVESPEPGWLLALIVDDGRNPEQYTQWEHVSVSALNLYRHKVRIPTWKEMCFVKNLCWEDEDVVIQFHPKKSEYVNYHPAVLHLWRYLAEKFPTPPPDLVGPRST